MSAAIVRESMLPEFYDHCNKVNANAWKAFEEKKKAFFLFNLNLEITVQRMELAHQKLVKKHLKEDTVDYLGTMFHSQPEEKNVWAVFQQVGPIPSVTPIADVKPKLPDFGCCQMFFPSPYMQACRRVIPEEPVPESKPWSQSSTPTSSSPLPSSSSDSSDSEQDHFKSGTSSDSGIESDVSGSTVKKMKKYKVFTAEEIKKRDAITDEWKKKIRDSLSV